MSPSVNESTFNAEVLRSPIPVLIHFWAPWCGLCRMIEPLLQSFQGEWEGQVRLVSVNADDNLKLANHFRLTTLPTLVVVQNGETCYRLESFRGRDDLRVALDAWMQSLSLTDYRLATERIPYQGLSIPE